MSRPRHRTCICIILLLIAALLVAGCLTAQPAAQVPSTRAMSSLIYYTEQMPPYNYGENGTLQGISIDLLEAITEKMGNRVSRDQVHLVSWTTGYQTALTRNTTVLFTTARLPEREQAFKWVGPIYDYTNVLFSRSDREIVLSSPEDLRGYQIGVIVDDVAIQQLLDAGVDEHQFVYETDVFAIIDKLESGEIDLFCYTEVAGRYFAEKATGNAYSFSVVYTLPHLEGYYAFNRDIPDSTVQSFQQALDALKHERDAAGISRYERILGRHIPSIGLAHLNYLTEEWAPFNYEEDGDVSGISVDILEAVFRSTGVNLTRADVRIVPLADGFQAAQGNGTVLFSIVRSPEREPLYKWAGPFTKSGFVVFAHVNRNITITSPADLNQYRIGAVRATIENELLTSRGVNASNILNGANPEELLRMLENGQIDLWATGDLAGRHQILKTASDPDAYEIVSTLSENDFYFLFSRDVPDTLVNAFQQALESVRDLKDAQGVSEYERILYRYLGVGCTRQPFTDEEVENLVNTTAVALERDAPDTFRRINAGEAPYRDPGNPALFVFVYDKNSTIVAHAENILVVGINHRGKTDVTGTPFHDQITAGAEKDGTGWVDESLL
ncbi:MAG: transporter substrate-binding domain-containing protein [Methanolinea sp.]|nr:transporter substrate-binding domain-containing protein [Methanolinea sp.]